jgi:hypothetical protein
MTAHTDTHQTAAQKVAQDESARKAALAEEKADKATAAPALSKEQKAVQVKADAQQKLANERATAEAKAQSEFEADVAAAAAKRQKTLEKFTDPTLENITCEAYETTKGVDDPPFREVQADYKGKLHTHADSVIRTGLPEVPTAFEQKVAELLTKKEYKDLQAQHTGTWGESPVRDAVAEDYKGDEDEKAVLQKNTKSDSKDTKK